MNNISLVGRLVADPELKYTADDAKAVVNFRLAVDRPFTRNKTDFFRIVVWGKQAEAVAEYLKKGSRCGIVGYLKTESFNDNDGNARYSTDIVANQVEFLNSKKESEV